MKTFFILYKAELKRFYTPAMIILSLALIGFGDVMCFGMSSMKQLQRTSGLIEVCYSMVSFFGVLIFSAGIVGSDVKSGWLRTVLIRSITRQQYILSKIAVIISVTVIAMTISVGIPLVYNIIIPNPGMIFDVSTTLYFFLLKNCELILLIIISSLFSCWITGAFNSLAVYIWLGAGGMIKFFISQKYWDIPWAMAIKEYIFPASFENALNVLKMGLDFPVPDILWGIASMTFFLSLALFSINKVQVDISSE